MEAPSANPQTETVHLGPRSSILDPRSSSTSGLMLIFLAGAILRLGLWVWFWDEPLNIWDERDYNTLAISLVEREEFAFDPGRPASLRPPLYPAVVAGVYQLFGIENYQAVRLLQAGLSLLTVLVVYTLGAEVFSPRVGLWQAGLYCFYPSLLAYNNLLLTETLFTFFLCAACLALVRFYRRGSIPYLLAAGGLLGLGALTRSVLWLFPPVLAVFVLVTWKAPLGRRVLAAGALVGAFAVTLAPWSIRNTRLEKTFVAVDTMGGRNFMMGNYQHTPLYRAWDAISLTGDRSWHHELDAEFPTFAKMTQGQRDKLALRRGLQFVMENPGLTLQRDIVKFFNFWGLERELVAGAARGSFGSLSGLATALLTLVVFGSYAAALVTGLFGMVLAPPQDKRLHWLMLLLIAYICGMHTLTFGHSRYHLPVMPFVLGYSASALVQARGLWQRKGERSFWLAGLLSSLFLLGWAWEVVVVDFERYRSAVLSSF
jgi:4-amino-4-deoxy-L-arabinose transferase-like glycosyltransferase